MGRECQSFIDYKNPKQKFCKAQHRAISEEDKCQRHFEQQYDIDKSSFYEISHMWKNSVADWW